jgi:hypothetical protein
MVKFRNLMMRLVLGSYTPRGAKVVLLAIIGIGLGIAVARVLGGIEPVTACGGGHAACVPGDSCCPGVMWLR